MRILLILIFSLFISFVASCQQPIDSGFTNKAEAENKMVNGLKEGKWVEYLGYRYDSNIKGWLASLSLHVIPKDSNPRYFRLVVYTMGKPLGIERGYYMSGKKWYEVQYSNGKKNGIKKEYYESGEFESQTPYINGLVVGTIKRYYKSGKLNLEDYYTNEGRDSLLKRYFEKNGNLNYEILFTDSENGIEKEYYESGKLKRISKYSDDEIDGTIKTYDENGNEIK